MIYFHGTTVKLAAGDLLVPGNKIGVSYHNRSDHVYLTHSSFSMSEVEGASSYIHTSEQHALETAIMWGAFAADMTCDNDCGGRDGSGFHFNTRLIQKGLLPSCVHVYITEPLGRLQYDDAHDCGPEGIAAESARVEQSLTREEMLQRLGVTT